MADGMMACLAVMETKYVFAWSRAPTDMCIKVCGVCCRYEGLTQSYLAPSSAGTGGGSEVSGIAEGREGRGVQDGVGGGGGAQGEGSAKTDMTGRDSMHGAQVLLNPNKRKHFGAHQDKLEALIGRINKKKHGGSSEDSKVHNSTFGSAGRMGW